MIMAQKVVLNQYPANGPIVVAGVTYSNIREIKQLANASAELSSFFGLQIERVAEEKMHFKDGWNCARLYKPHPCFDCYDDACEDRRYNNYVLRRGEITDEFIQDIVSNVPRQINYNMANEQAPARYLPIVYHDGERDTVIVAEAIDE